MNLCGIVSSVLLILQLQIILPSPVLILENLRKVNKKIIVNQLEYFVGEIVHIVLSKIVYGRERDLLQCVLRRR